MNLIRNARVADVASSFYGQKVDVRIGRGHIEAIGPAGTLQAERFIDAEGMWLFPGLVDVMARWGIPHSDAAETLESGVRSAMQGGFSQVFLSPTSYPFYNNAAAIEALRAQTSDAPIVIHPTGSASAAVGKWQMAPVGEMIEAGARAIAVEGLAMAPHHLQSLMEYMQPWEVPLIIHPQTHSRETPLAWEGPTAVRMGLKGERPESEREWAQTIRHLSHRTGIHTIFYPASDPEVAAMADEYFHPGTDGFHVVWNDRQLLRWDARYKFSPPLRPAAFKEKTSLLRRLAFIASGHQPVLPHQKEDDFVAAEAGAIGHATLLPLLQDAFDTQFFLEQILPLLTHRPRELLGLPPVTIEEGSPAEMVLYHPAEQWTLDEASSFSRASNAPLWGQTVTGRVHWLLTPRGTFNVRKS